MPVLKEIILDVTDPEAPMLAEAPGDAQTRAGEALAETWARRYHGMQSYESAIDAAGYETEAEMHAPGAERAVRLCQIGPDGAISWTEQRRVETIPAGDDHPSSVHVTPARDVRLEASEIYAHFGMEAPGTLFDARIALKSEGTVYAEGEVRLRADDRMAASLAAARHVEDEVSEWDERIPDRSMEIELEEVEEPVAELPEL